VLAHDAIRSTGSRLRYSSFSGIAFDLVQCCEGLMITEIL
jgi:hypothetical protein